MSAVRPLDHLTALDLAGGYVLGALSREEMDAVRTHLVSCTESHADFEALGGPVQYLALALDPIEPAASLRGRVLSAVAAGDRDRERALAPARPRVERPSWWRRVGRLGWAAAVVAIVVLAVSTGFLAGQLGTSRSYADELARALALASQPGSRVVVLAAQPGSGVGTTAGGLAVLPASGSGVIVVQGLGPTSGSQVYEAWVIAGSAAPVPAGSFTVSTDGRGVLGSMAPASPGAVTVALTREPGPGATTPTLPILVAGAARTS